MTTDPQGKKRIPFERLPSYDDREMLARASEFRNASARRRTIRHFSDRPVPPDVIRNCVLAAGTAPSGANQQPWHFCVVSDPELKSAIRSAAESEEREFYESRAPQPWLDAIEPLGVDAEKPFLETAPYLIVVFRRAHETGPDGATIKQYYSTESVGIATGILITALHHCGLSTLTHTPSPMTFLCDLLKRPSNERPFVILVVGHAAEDATVPVISKKTFAEISTIHGSP